jgi:DNA-binding SARP family transcriptional activator
MTRSHIHVRTPLVAAATSLLRVTGRVVRGLFAAVVLAGLLAGLPWAAWHFVGWPLPHHIPTWEQVKAVLAQPASTDLVVDVLACLCWLVWAAFALDVARCTVAAVRTLRWASVPAPQVPGGLVQAVAAALVGTIVLSVLGNRTPPARGPVPDHPAAVPTAAPAGADPAGPPLAFTSPAAVVAQAPEPLTAAVPRPDPAPAPGRPWTVMVRPPARGIHDSLWRIADRNLGDGARWPEIYRLNRGRLQPDGQRLLSPNLIYPGWRLTLPGHANPAHRHGPHHRHGHPTPPPAPHQPAPPPRTPSPQLPAPPSPPAIPAPTPGGDRSPTARPSPGIDLPGGGYVGLALAGLITAAALTLRQRRRGHPDPDSRREDAEMTPVIRALRLAHDETHRSDTATGRPSLSGDDGDGSRPLPLPAAVTPAAGPAGAGMRPAVLSVRNGHARALELARTRGLGLIGPGAVDAARALLVSLLATAHQPDAEPVTVVIPADVATVAIPDATGRRRPSRLRITPSLDTLLDEAEVDLVTRTRLTPERRALLGALVLLAAPQEHADRRLQAVLDNGSPLGITGILLGQWRPGGTVRIREDGTVAAASPDVADALEGTRLFTLPTSHTTDLLGLLAAADPPDHDPAVVHDDGEEASGDEDNGEETVAHDAHPADADTDTDPGTMPEAGTPPPAGEDRPAADPHPAPHRGGTPGTPSAADTSGDSTPTPPHAADPAPFRRPALTPDPSSTAGSGRSDTLDAPATSAAPAQQPVPTAGPAVPAVPLRLTVLGRLHLHHQPRTSRREPGRRADLIGALAPRQREILVYLALHHNGARREALAAAIWPDAPAERPYNSFHATLSQLRKALANTAGEKLRHLVVHGEGRYRLNADLVDVDLWRLRDALTTAARGTGPDRLAALRAIPDLYPGDLADELTADWLTAPRQTLHRDVLDALSALIRAAGDQDPRQHLAWLEHARTLDPHNEDLYRRIIRAQARVGRHDAIPRTISLLTTALADIDRRPDADTLTLADQLQRSPATHPA